MTRSGGKVKLSAALSFSLTQMTEPDTVTRRSDHTGFVSRLWETFKKRVQLIPFLFNPNP